MEDQEDCSYIPITFDSKLIYGFFQSTICTKYVDPVIQNLAVCAMHIDYSEKLAYDFSRPYAESHLPGQRKSLISMSWIFPYICRLCGNCWQSIFPLQAVSPASDLTEYERIRKILSYIEQNYMNRITLTDISENIHLCESECTRLFKRHMNTTLFAFLKEYRIERSLEYLNTKESISSIAEKTGFSDSNYYTKVFSKIKGCSPREYRKNLLKQ